MLFYANMTKSERSVFLHKKNKLSELLTAASRDRDRASLAEKEADLLWDPPKIWGWLKALSVGGWQDGWWISVELWAVQLLCQDWKQHIEKAFFSGTKHLSSGGGRDASVDFKSIERNLWQLRWKGMSRLPIWKQSIKSIQNSRADS